MIKGRSSFQSLEDKDLILEMTIDSIAFSEFGPFLCSLDALKPDTVLNGNKIDLLILHLLLDNIDLI